MTWRTDGVYSEFRKVLSHIGMAEHHVLHKNFYMSMGAVNPALTAMANPIRVGEHIAELIS